MLNSATIQHLFKLVWNRKRSNTLIMIELFATFLVLAGVSTTIIHFSTVFVQPLGYEYKGVWNVLAYRKDDGTKVPNSVKVQTAQNIVAVLRSLPEVQSTSFISTTPFGFSHWTTDFGRRDNHFQTEICSATDDFAATMGLTLSQGRWFDATDDVMNGTTGTVKPVVINRIAAETFFGKENPLGKEIIEMTRESDAKAAKPMHYRVIGVIPTFRKGSEFDQSGNFMFRRVSLLDSTIWLPSQLLIKMKHGTDAAYEEKLLKILQQAAPDWVFQISTLEADREKKHKFFLIPLGVGMTIAAFLLLMVALGLVGVVWQSVMRRMREIGVRRAFGANRGDVTFFIIGELAAITTFSVVLGIIVLAQLPLIPFFDLPAATYLTSIGAAVAAMYGLTGLCAFYPSRLAARVQPSEALRYE